MNPQLETMRWPNALSPVVTAPAISSCVAKQMIPSLWPRFPG